MVDWSNWPEIERSMVNFFENLPEDLTDGVKKMLAVNTAIKQGDFSDKEKMAPYTEAIRKKSA